MNSKRLLEQLLQLTVWLPIKNYDNYEVSICGMVRNITSKRILKNQINNHNYYHVILYKNGKSKIHYIHHIVAIHFIPNINNAKCIDHINNNKLDNTVSNLRWCTQQQNCFNRSLSSKKNTSGIKGISWYKKKNKWIVQIGFNNKLIYLGYFDNLDDAKAARQAKANELFGEYINACEL